MGTARREDHTRLLGFSRADKSTLDTTRAVVLYGSWIPISGQTDFRDSDPYKEKTTLPRALADVSKQAFVADCGPEGPLPSSVFGNINPIPFRGVVFACRLDKRHTPYERISPHPLGPTDPCSTAVHMEPFSSLVLKGLT